MTERSSLLAATAAERLGLAPRVVHLDTTSVQVDGRDHRDAEPEAQVGPITRGDRREHQPACNQVRWELMVEPHAGLPLLMPPLSGTSSAPQGGGEAVRRQVQQWHTTYGLTSLVADRALYRGATLEPLAQTQMKWSTRVPATVHEAPAALAQAAPQAMVALPEGSRAHELPSPDGGVEPRWVLISSAPRQAQAQRTVDTPGRQPSDQDVNALQKVGGVTCACEAEARQALAPFAQDLQATWRGASTGRAMPRDGKRGRPGPGVQPDQRVYQIEGTVAASRAARQAVIDQHRCCMLAPHELDAPHCHRHSCWQATKASRRGSAGVAS